MHRAWHLLGNSSAYDRPGGTALSTILTQVEAASHTSLIASVMPTQSRLRTSPKPRTPRGPQRDGRLIHARAVLRARRRILLRKPTLARSRLS